jgi:dihydrofolate reductase
MALSGQSPAVQEFAGIWRDADKVVYSSQLASAASARTRIEREFDPAAVQLMKDTASRDLTVGGPGLAEHAIRAGLVDEYQVIVVPVLVGGGTPALPDGVRIDLSLADVRRFDNGFVFLRYLVR